MVTGKHADCPTSTPFIFRTAGPADSSSSRSSLSFPFQLQSTQPQSFGSHTGATRAALRKGETATDGPVAGVAGTSGSSGGAADHGRLDLSGYRYTGMGPGRPGAGPVVGRYTLMASSIPISLPINSGRRAPVLEGGGHSCPFVSSDGDAARECQSQSVTLGEVRGVIHLGRHCGISFPHSMQASPSKCSLIDSPGSVEAFAMSNTLSID